MTHAHIHALLVVEEIVSTLPVAFLMNYSHLIYSRLLLYCVSAVVVVVIVVVMMSAMSFDVVSHCRVVHDSIPSSSK